MGIFSPYHRNGQRRVAMPAFDRLENYGWTRETRPGDTYPTFTLDGTGITLTTNLADPTARTSILTLPDGRREIITDGDYARMTQDIIDRFTEELFVHVVDNDQIPYNGEPVTYNSEANDYGLQPAA